MAAKQTAVLRYYKGNKVLKDESGKVANENNEMTLTYNDLQWNGHLENIKKMGVCKVEVVGFYEGNKEVEKEDIPKELIAQIEALLKTPETSLTPQEQKIKDLEAKVEALLNASKVTAEPKAEEFKLPETLKELKDESLAGGGTENSANAKVPDAQKEPTQAEKDLMEATEKYKAKFNKDVATRFKNDITWINKELAKEL